MSHERLTRNYFALITVSHTRSQIISLPGTTMATQAIGLVRNAHLVTRMTTSEIKR
ncbi:MAG: hypothetical protein ONB44_04685 [candidate division KSB1 bacterium]|nr:hypothetical protein [candidate division KSB1 bacterium]